MIGQRPRGTRDFIASEIRKDIMKGRLRLGERIHEMEYAERFDVSRTPVREALLSLVPDGLVIVRPQAGTYVISFDTQGLRELFEVRELLEREGVHLATPAQRKDLVEALRKKCVAMEMDVSSPAEFDEFSDIDTKFHSELASASNNAHLIRIYRPIEVSAQAARSRLAKSAAISNKANAHHWGMVEALANDDLPAFDERLHDHLTWVFEMLRMRLDLLGTEGPTKR